MQPACENRKAGGGVPYFRNEEAGSQGCAVIPPKPFVQQVGHRGWGQRRPFSLSKQLGEGLALTVKNEGASHRCP